MTETTRKTLGGAAVIVAVGLVIGIANNILAGPERHLEWVGSYPEKGEPACLKVKPEGVSGPAAPVGTTAVGGTPPAPSGATGETGPMGETAPGGETAPSGETAPAGSTGPAGPTGPAETTAAVALPPTAAVEIPPVPPDKQWLELEPAQVKALFDQNALFVDARRRSVYEEGHVPGAVSISPWESGVDEKVQNLFFDPRIAGSTESRIVVYCNGGDCEDSHMIGDKLWENKFTAVYVYHDGWPDWTANKWPVTTGAQP